MINRCHVCGSTKIAYWHTVSPNNNPAVMINVAYCKRCAELIDRFEQDLYKWTVGGRMNYEGALVVCSRCGAELGYIYTSPKGRAKRAYCPACFRYLMTGEGEL